MQRTFISMSWTPGVSEDDAQVMIRAVEDIYALLRRQFGERPGQFDPLPVVRIFGSWAIPNLPAQAPYANVTWYVRQSLDPGTGQLIGSRYLETVIQEPWQATSPHFDLAMTELTLLDDVGGGAGRPAATPNALGMTRRGLLALISTHAFAGIESPELRRLALRHMVAHVFGSLVDAPRRGRPGTLLHRGQTYCQNICALRVTGTPEQALIYAQEELASGELYCDPCQKDLASQIAGLHFGLN